MNERTRSRTRTGALAGAALLFAGGLVVVAVARGQHGGKDRASELAAIEADADPLAILERSAKGVSGDASTWAALGQGYFNAGRYSDAVRAYDRATQLAPNKALLWSALGEARVMASPHDPMPPAAVTDFDRSLALDAYDPRGRYFKAVRRDLAGDHAAAIDAWLGLLADTPAGAPWEADLRRTIVQVGRINHMAVADRLAAVKQPTPATGAAGTIPASPTGVGAEAAIPGPTAEQLQSASSIPPSQQDAMARGMVARLETRLKDQPHNIEGWVLLIRSRTMLNQSEKASAALAAAVAANPAAADSLRKQATAIGVR